MGKFQSKLASKRRQSPEGGSLASNMLSGQRELERSSSHKTKLTENLYMELRENTSDCHSNLKVDLPPKRTHDRGDSIHFQVNKQMRKRSSHADATESNVPHDDDSQQEWVFTLYNFDHSGKIIKEDMCSLIHSMYEVLEASVKQPDGGITPLRIKLVVTPSEDPENTSQIAQEEQSASQEAGKPERRRYCMDENIERRNHYLDLAGIENYTSKFDNTESPTQESRQDVHSALEYHPVVISDNCISPESPRSSSVPHFLKSKAMPVGKDKNGGEGKSCRFHGQHPVSWCQPQSSGRRTHSKRLRFRVQETASYFKPILGGDKEIFSHHQPLCGALASPAQRHAHHHHHEHHHHHHHHHHYQPS